MCNKGMIDGAIQVGRSWMIPEDVQKPHDRRTIATAQNKPIVCPKKTFDGIDGKKDDVWHLRPVTEGEALRLQEEFLIEYTYHSNALEGNTLTLFETSMIVKEGITIGDKSLKDHLEVIGHKEAYDHVFALARGNTPLSEKVILDVHSLVLMDKPQDRGRYRNIPIHIVGASHKPPSPEEVPEKMQFLLEEYRQMKNTLHPVQSAALFHLLFEGVHPFVDGNGRTGRLLLNLELMKHGYPPINITCSDRKKYYQSFHDFFETGNSRTFTLMVVAYIEEMLNKYLEMIKR